MALLFKLFACFSCAGIVASIGNPSEGNGDLSSPGNAGHSKIKTSEYKHLLTRSFTSFQPSVTPARFALKVNKKAEEADSSAPADEESGFPESDNSLRIGLHEPVTKSTSHDMASVLPVARIQASLLAESASSAGRQLASAVGPGNVSLLQDNADSASSSETKSGSTKSTTQACGFEEAVPDEGADGRLCDQKCLQRNFDEMREDYGIIEENQRRAMPDAAKCNRKDICLLQQQLDMDFFRRARLGVLTESEEETELETDWLKAGNCNKQSRGKRMTPVTDVQECKDVLSANNIKAAKKFKVSFPKYPSGCLKVTRGRMTRGLLNVLKTTADAHSKYVSKGGTQSIKVTVEQYCVQDRTLDEASAFYYSPYKLDHSMHGNDMKNGAFCSFGAIADLSNLGMTKSPCAKILAYRPPAKYQKLQAADALKQLEGMQAGSKEARELKSFVDGMKKKNILMDIFANHWCTDVWTEAMSDGNTCTAHRTPTWAVKSDNQAVAEERPPKLALATEACADINDDEKSLAEMMQDMPDTPPDFYRAATV